MSNLPRRGEPFWSIPANPAEPGVPSDGGPPAGEPARDGDAPQSFASKVARPSTAISLEDARRVVEMLEAGPDADPADAVELIRELGLGGRGVMAHEAILAMQRLASDAAAKAVSPVDSLSDSLSKSPAAGAGVVGATGAAGQGSDAPDADDAHDGRDPDHDPDHDPRAAPAPPRPSGA